MEREEFIKSMHSCIMACDDPEVAQIWFCAGWDGDEDSLPWCCEDDQFQHIMTTFMWLIGKSRIHGGMTVDGVHAEENW